MLGDGKVDVEMEASPGYSQPADLTAREQFRWYGSSQDSTDSKIKDLRLRFDGQSMHSRTNAVLLLEDIKQEADNMDSDHFDATPRKVQASSEKKMAIVDPELHDGIQSLKACKMEDESADCGEVVLGLVPSLLDPAIQGLIRIPDLIFRFARSCHSVSKNIRSQSNIRHQVLADELMRQKVQLLLDKAGTWSLLWHLYGKGTEERPKDLLVSPPISHVEAWQFVVNDHTTQLCLRFIAWLEELASKSLDLESEIREPRVGTYLQNWYNTQWVLKKVAFGVKILTHSDVDATTAEHGHRVLDDQKEEECLLGDVWTLISRTLHAIELESGIGHQWSLWKWAAAYCASEKIVDQNGRKYEASVYAAQCSNLKRMLPVFEDHALVPIPDLILRFERSCHNVSEDIRSQSNIRHRVLEDTLMRQKVQLLFDEAGTSSLLWHLYGKAVIFGSEFHKERAESECKEDMRGSIDSRWMEGRSHG